MSILDVICDNSQQDLDEVPAIIMQMSNLKMLYMENNRLTSLPEDFFYRLPLLNWLDLRNNQLTAIPASIEFHSFLENLLLQNNKITKLPNELGVVPNLKVLQISGNPLHYPCKEITENGIDDICAFLKLKYDKEHLSQNHNIYVKDPHIINTKISCISSTSTKSSQSKPSIEDIRRNVRKRFVKSRSTKPDILTVKSLSKIHQKYLQNEKVSLELIDNVQKNNLKDQSTDSQVLFTQSSKGKNVSPSERKVHKIESKGSKLSVRSHYDNKFQIKVVNSSRQSKDGTIRDFDEDRSHEKRIQGQQLKDLWLAKLKDLLHDQEKIIQQERNLAALDNWRQEKRSECARETDPDGRKPIEPPYDVDPAYSKFPSRSDLSKQLDKLVRRVDGAKPPRHVDVQRLINNLIKQLQEIETSAQEAKGLDVTPRKKLESTEKEIGMIMDLHKKITKLQNQNKV